MQGLEEKTKTIAALQRETNSRSGNPRFTVFFTDGTSAMTSSDISCAYKIGNPGIRDGSRVVVELTKAGRISDIKAAQVTRGDVISDAFKLDPKTVDERPSSKFNGTDDALLALAISVIAGHGVADEIAGSTHEIGFAMRVGRFVAVEDERGFIDVRKFDTLAEAEGFADSYEQE